LFLDSTLMRYIEQQILVYKRSPDSILGGLRVNRHSYKTMICTKTLYNNIDKGHLFCRNIDLVLKPSLKTKTKRLRQHKRQLGQSIELRPSVVDDRQEFGHWEADNIKGKDNKSSVLTLVERKTNKSFILQVDSTKARDIIKAFERLFALCKGTHLFKTITYDNGSEFAECYKFSSDYGIQVYFAHPYSAYERGINENYNNILRRYIPKGKDISKLTQQDLDRIYNIIDYTPRKRHNYKHPINYLKKNF